MWVCAPLPACVHLCVCHCVRDCVPVQVVRGRDRNACELNNKSSIRHT